jgi:hypothetical protein
MRSLLVMAFLLGGLDIAAATVLGGGLARTDCRMVFRGVTATDGESGVVCVDGDPTCDIDAVPDGTCHFAVQVCTGTSTPTCDTTPLSAAHVAGLHLPPPPLPAPDGTCGRETDVAVPAGRAAGATVVAGDGDSLRDVDYLALCCVSAPPTPYDVARCATAIDLRVSGCPARKIRPRARRALTRARALVEAFGHDPIRPELLRKARRKLAVVHRAARTVAKRDSCGDALGLVVSYADGAVGRAAGAATSHAH